MATVSRGVRQDVHTPAVCQVNSSTHSALLTQGPGVTSCDPQCPRLLGTALQPVQSQQQDGAKGAGPPSTTERRKMELSIVPASAYRTMRWKNGKGLTDEMMIWPADARFPEDPFEWRLSSAVVSASSDFSHFHQHNRFLFLLSCDRDAEATHSNPQSIPPPMAVRTVDPSGHGQLFELHVPGDVCHLDGSAATHAAVPADVTRIRDLNFFYRKSSVRVHCCHAVALSERESLAIPLSGSWCLVIPLGVRRPIGCCDPGTPILVAASCGAGGRLPPQTHQLPLFDTLVVRRSTPAGPAEPLTLVLELVAENLPDGKPVAVDIAIIDFSTLQTPV